MNGTVVRLFHPRQDRWAEHFSWNEDFTQIIGRTSTGRATVEHLHLNRVGLINQRILFGLAKRQPPYWEIVI